MTRTGTKILALAVSAVVFFCARITASPVKNAATEYAGTTPALLSIKITGNRVPLDFYIPQLIMKVENNIRTKPGGRFYVDRTRIIAPDYITRGHTSTALVSVLTWGRNYRSARSYTAVRIENVVIEDFGRCSRLYVSNNPELLTETGLLLEGKIDAQESVRYLIHHKNGVGRPLELVMLAENKADETAVLHIVEGTFETDILESPPGHRTAHSFARNLLDNRGSILELPPGETAIHQYELAPEEIISGVGDMRLLSGDNITFKIKVLDPMRYVTAWARPIGEFDSSRGHGVYGPPYILIKDKFELGGRWKFINIGDNPLRSLNGDHSPLKGNYGVTYRLEVSLDNPFPRTERVELHFNPSAGPARGVIIVDGTLVKTNLVKPPDSIVIGEFDVSPKGHRTVNVEITPESGSYYPVRLVFRTAGIQSASR